MTKINDVGPDANGWMAIYQMPAPKDGDIHLFWDEVHGVIHGRWCEYDDEYVGDPSLEDEAWEFHTFDGDYLPGADPIFWFPLPKPPVSTGGGS